MKVQDSALFVLLLLLLVSRIAGIELVLFLSFSLWFMTLMSFEWIVQISCVCMFIILVSCFAKYLSFSFLPMTAEFRIKYWLWFEWKWLDLRGMLWINTSLWHSFLFLHALRKILVLVVLCFLPLINVKVVS